MTSQVTLKLDRAESKQAALDYVNERQMGKKVFTQIKTGAFIKALQ
jgi:hypothetical protein